MSPAKFRWGILFILVGVLLLLNNIGQLDWWVWSEILSLWPLILIAIGLEKIFTPSKGEFIAYLPILGLAAVVLWVAFSGNFGDDDNLIRRGSTYRYTLDMEADIERVEAKFDLGDIDATLSSTGTRLFRARTDVWRRIPKVDFDENGGVAKLDLSSQTKRIPNWIKIDKWGRDGEWDLFLNDGVPISLQCNGDKSDMTLDCRNLLLEDLAVISTDGDIRINIGKLKETVNVKLEGAGADYRLSVPNNCGLKISGDDNQLARILEKLELVESGGFYATAGYDTLMPRIEIDLADDVTQFTIDNQ